MFHPAAAKYLGRYVDADVNVAIGADPVAQLIGDGFYHPICQQPGQRGVLDEWDELAGRNDPGWPAPSNKFLRADTAPIVERDGG